MDRSGSKKQERGRRVKDPVEKAVEQIARTGGLSVSTLRATSLLGLLDIRDKSWSSQEVAVALAELIQKLTAQVTHPTHRLALRAALNTTTAEELEELGDTYRRHVAEWVEKSTLPQRVADLRRCWDASNPSQALWFEDDAKATDDAIYFVTRKWWYRGRERLATLLKSEIEWRNEQQTWERPSPDTLAAYADSIRCDDVREQSQERPAGGQAYVTEDERADHLPSGYVRREREEARFNQLVTQGSKLIALVGPPGVGKTLLARALTVDAPRIRVVSGRIELSHVEASLLKFRTGIDEISSADPAGSFVRLLSDTSAQYIMLDCLNSTDELRMLLPPGLSPVPVIVAACRFQGETLPAGCDVLIIGRMTDSEAANMIQNRLPGVAPRDTARLAAVLEGYPLLVSHVSGLVAGGNLSIDKICRNPLAHFQRIARDVSTEDGAPLHEILTYLVSLVLQRSPAAYMVLVHVSSCGGMPHVRKDYLGYFLAKMSGPHLVTIDLGLALRILVNFGFIEVGAAQITMHPFIQEALYTVFQDNGDLEEVSTLFFHEGHDLDLKDRRPFGERDGS